MNIAEEEVEVSADSGEEDGEAKEEEGKKEMKGLSIATSLS